MTLTGFYFGGAAGAVLLQYLGSFAARKKKAKTLADGRVSG